MARRPYGNIGKDVRWGSITIVIKLAGGVSVAVVNTMIGRRP